MKRIIRLLWRYYFNNIYVPSINILRLLPNIVKARIHDRQCPLKGEIYTQGYANRLLSEKSIKFLATKFDSPLTIDKEWVDVLEEILDSALPECEKYLGSDLVISHVAFWETTLDDIQSISNNWHTDNVGHNLKIFCCIEGDGSQPTMIVRNSNLIPIGFNKNLFMQVPRWRGNKVDNKLKNEIELRHSKGTLYIFDTNALHRGGYEHSKSTRKIFELDLICRRKYLDILFNKYKGLDSLREVSDASFKDKFKYFNLIQ